MLTKQDLEAIDNLVTKRVEPLKQRVAAVETSLRSEFREEVSSVVNSVGSLTKTVGTLGNVVDDLRKEMKSGFRKINRELNKLHNGQEIIIKFFNEEALSLKKRVDKIENHLKLPPIS